MSCLILNTGIVQECRNSLGGIKEFFVAEFEGIEDSYITVVSGAVTAIDAAVHFYTFKPTKDSSTASAPFEGDVAAGQRSYNHTVVMQFARSETAKRNAVAVLAEKSVVVIAKDNNGNFFFYGWDRGLDQTEGDNPLGTTSNDLNGYSVTLSGAQATMPMQVGSAVVAGITKD